MKRVLYTLIFFVLIASNNNIYAQKDPFNGLNLRINNLFFEEYIPAMIKNGDISDSYKGERSLEKIKKFAPDGLRPRGNIGQIKWNKSKIKLLFLLKDCNGQSDARGYSDINSGFLRKVARLVYAFNKLTKNNYPPLNTLTADMQLDAYLNFPHAHVNIKKRVGGPSVSPSLIKKYAKNYKVYTLKEIDILKPNVILCGGTFNIAKEHLFQDYQIEKICERIYFSKSKKVIIIDSYHPAAPRTNYELYDLILDNFIKAVNIISKKYHCFNNI